MAPPTAALTLALAWRRRGSIGSPPVLLVCLRTAAVFPITKRFCFIMKAAAFRPSVTN